MRLFTAIELAPAVLEELVNVRSVLEERLPFRRWSPVENLHLTVRFFGEIPEEALHDLLETHMKACGSLAPFSLELGQPGVFPRHGRPRVLWVGVGGELTALAATERILREAIPMEERRDTARYSPHITLARESTDKLPSGLLETAVSIRPAPWKVEAIALFRSTTTPTGARYEVLERFHLGNASGRRA